MISLEGIFEGLSKIKVSVYNNMIVIDNIDLMDSLSLNDIWNNKLIPYCKENGISIISLIDKYNFNRDILGTNFGFSKKNSNNERYVYIGLDNDKENTLIENIINDMINGTFDLEFTSIICERLGLNNVHEYINIATDLFVDRIYKGDLIYSIGN